MGAVPAWHDLLAKLAGPLASLLAGAICLAIARRRPGFGWATAAFTNASLRLLPLAFDLARALRGGAGSRPGWSISGA